jgi:hypothetical protein
MSLTRRQQTFVLEYLADPERNGAASARRAGFKAKRAAITASELLHDPKIQTAIQDHLTNHLRRLHVDAEMVITGIVETIQKAKAAGSGAWQSATILRGYELLGRSLGMFHDKVDVNNDDEIIKRLMAGRRRAAGLPEEEEDGEEKQEDSADDPRPN